MKQETINPSDYDHDDGEPVPERVCMSCSVAGCECDEYDHVEGE